MILFVNCPNILEKSLLRAACDLCRLMAKKITKIMDE